MGSSDGKRKRARARVRKRSRAVFAWFAVAAAAALLLPASAAEAGILNRAKELYRLPDQVEQMEKDYDAAKAQLEETMRQSRETEQQLVAQNKQLQEQNEALRQRLEAMEQQGRDKEARMRRLTNVGITAASLSAVYFISARLFRVALWRREQSGKRPYAPWRRRSNRIEEDA